MFCSVVQYLSCLLITLQDVGSILVLSNLFRTYAIVFLDSETSISCCTYCPGVWPVLAWRSGCRVPIAQRWMSPERGWLCQFGTNRLVNHYRPKSLDWLNCFRTSAGNHSGAATLCSALHRAADCDLNDHFSVTHNSSGCKIRYGRLRTFRSNSSCVSGIRVFRPLNSILRILNSYVTSFTHRRFLCTSAHTSLCFC